MDAVQLERELWAVNAELVKAGIEPRKYESMAKAVEALRLERDDCWKKLIDLSKSQVASERSER